MTADRNRSETVFYGWKLVAALSVILFFTAGGGFYVFPVFIESYQKEFGWSMTQISVGAAIFALVMGFSNPLVGNLFERFTVRKTMLVAGLLTVATTLVLASLTALWMLYAAMVVMGFAVTATTILPAQTVVTNWFDKLRSRAMGFTMLGIGLGGFLLPPFNELMIRLIGWRLTWVVAAGVMAAIVIPLIAVFVRSTPADLGLLPDGTSESESHDGESNQIARGLSVKAAIHTQTFWVLASVFTLQLFGVSILNFHFVPFAIQEAGFGSQPAAFFYGLTVGWSIVGRLLFGWLGDRWSPTALMAVTLLMMTLGVTVLEVLIVHLGLREANLLWLYSAPFGAGLGGHAVLLPVVTSRCFGALHFSKIMGLIMAGFAIGVLLGIPVAGWIFDSTGSYELALILAGSALLIAAVLMTTVRADRHRADFATA